MNFSKKSRYGLRALIDLSVYSKESHVALAAIAERNSISPQYLEQVFAALRKAGIIKSVKGPPTPKCKRSFLWEYYPYKLEIGYFVATILIQ